MNRQHAPGWYRDPRDPARLRRWNGRSWTRHTRPVPDWVRQLPPKPSSAPATRSRARRLWSLCFICIAAALVALAVQQTTGRDVETIGDRDFTRAAERRCAAAAGEIADSPRTGEDAARIAALVAEWELMVRDLRELPVNTNDRPAVERWLDDWDNWLDAGSRYVAALTDGDERRANLVSEVSEPAKRRIDAFALANGMPSCVI